MSISKLLAVTVLLGGLLAVNSANAQTQLQMTRAQANPAQKLFRLVATDGTVVAADGQTRRFYIKGPGGAPMQEITFDQVLAHAEPNATRRALLKAKFEAALANPQMANYTYIYSPPGPCVPPPGQEHCQIDPNTTRSRTGYWNSVRG